MDKCLLFLPILELKGLEGWERLGYVHSFDASLGRPEDNVPRVDCSSLSHQDFIEQYEKKCKPVVLTGCQKHWLANRKWTLKVSFYTFASHFICLVESIVFSLFEDLFFF